MSLQHCVISFLPFHQLLTSALFSEASVLLIFSIGLLFYFYTVVSYKALIRPKLLIVRPDTWGTRDTRILQYPIFFELKNEIKSGYGLDTAWTWWGLGSQPPATTPPPNSPPDGNHARAGNLDGR